VTTGGPQSLLLPLLLLRRAGVRTGEWFPLRRLGLGEPRGSRRRLLIGACGAGHVDGQDALGGRGVRCDGKAMTGAPRFGFGRQPKR
jgi:hypothetical protein